MQTLPGTYSVINRRLIGRVACLAVVSLSVFFLQLRDVVWSQNAGSNSAEPITNDWPQFLGPHRNGIANETELLKRWPDGGPREVWRVAGGVGMSGLAVANGRLVTLLQRDGRQRIVVFDPQTGSTIRDIPFAREYKNSMGHGPRATPTLVGDMAYAFSGEGILLGVELGNGRIVWEHNVVKEFKGKPADYGMACSPLVVGDTVLVTAGAPDATVVAFDRKTGDHKWSAGKNSPAGYSSPALLNVAGEQQLVVFSGNSVAGVSPSSGKPLWSFDYETDFDCNIATPLAFKGQVFIASGENHGCALLAVNSDGGNYDTRAVWTSFGPSSVMRNEWQTSVLLDGHLFGFDNVGSAGPVTHLNCVEISTGKKVWQEKRFGKGNLIAADGKLWISTMKGELVVVRADPKQFEEIGRKKVLDSTRQMPSLAGGLLYLRDDREIVCLDIRD